jgi:hypothetical protein
MLHKVIVDHTIVHEKSRVVHFILQLLAKSHHMISKL